jgi:hypothetical protein
LNPRRQEFVILRASFLMLAASPPLPPLPKR